MNLEHANFIKYGGRVQIGLTDQDTENSLTRKKYMVKYERARPTVARFIAEDKKRGRTIPHEYLQKLRSQITQEEYNKLTLLKFLSEERNDHKL